MRSPETFKTKLTGICAYAIKRFKAVDLTYTNIFLLRNVNQILLFDIQIGKTLNDSL